MKTAKRIKGILPVIIICIISLALEALLSNFVYFSYVAGNNDIVNFQPKDIETVEITGESKSMSIDGLCFPLHSVSFNIKTTDEPLLDSLINADFFVADANNTESAGLAKTEKLAVGGQVRRVTVFLNSYGNARNININFDGFNSDLVVSDVTVNPEYQFAFNTVRFSAVFILIVIFYIMKYNGAGELVRKGMTYEQASMISAAVCAVAAVIFWGMGASGEAGNFIPYPLEGNVASYSPYIQQFDAFMKGQLHLDIEPSTELLALENPYSLSERSGVPALFDRAFYDGKYYSYFGIAPVFTVYYPIYLLIKGLPTDSTVMGIFSFITAIFLPLAVVGWAKLRDKSIRPWLAFVCAVGAYFASMSLLIQRGRTPFYYVASAAGMAFVSAFLFFVIKALSAKRRFVRIALMAAAGFSFGLGFLSRINSVLPAAITVVAFVIVYAVRSLKEKRYLRFFSEMAALALPVAAAIAFSLYYNYVRFDNPLQFGTDYQLTVANVSTYELYAGGIIPSVFHYFLQPFDVSNIFPYINLQRIFLSDYGRSLYIDSSFGILAIPFMLSLLLTPILFKSKGVPKDGKILLSVSVASLFITAFANFCLGGVIFRYTSDISLLAAFISAAVIIEISLIMQEKYGGEFASIVKKGITVLSAATALFALSVSITLNGNLVQYDPDIYLSIKDFFVFWS